MKIAGFYVVEVWLFMVRVWSEAAIDLRGSDYATASGFIFISKSCTTLSFVARPVVEPKDSNECLLLL